MTLDKRLNALEARKIARVERDPPTPPPGALREAVKELDYLASLRPLTSVELQARAECLRRLEGKA